MIAAGHCKQAAWNTAAILRSSYQSRMCETTGLKERLFRVGRVASTESLNMNALGK